MSSDWLMAIIGMRIGSPFLRLSKFLSMTFLVRQAYSRSHIRYSIVEFAIIIYHRCTERHDVILKCHSRGDGGGRMEPERLANYSIQHEELIERCELFSIQWNITCALAGEREGTAFLPELVLNSKIDA
jgi:hypothetical protein